MATDAATFAKQLKEDGIDAARREAEKILADAKAEAGRIAEAAKRDAERLEKEARERIARDRTRAEEEFRLVARDLANAFRKRIEETGLALLRVKVADALNEKEVVRDAIAEILKRTETGQAWEIALSAKIGKPLSDTVLALFKEKGATAKLAAELAKAGFELRADGGNEVFELTEDSVIDAFRRLLSPELRKHLGA